MTSVRHIGALVRRVAALLGAAAIMAGIAHAAEPVTLRLNFAPFAGNIPVYVAKAKGFYDRAGLTVTIESGRGSSFSAQVVGSGKEEFGIADAASVLVARAQGIPIVALLNLQQDAGMALFATQTSGINRVEDLKGKNVGVYTGSTTTIFLQALLSKHGMSMDDILPVTVRSGTDLPLVLDGKIDGEVTIMNNELTAWSISHPELKLRVWNLRDLGFPAPGLAIITNEDMIKNKPALVRGFAAATVQGIDYALQHPDEAVDILTGAVPELKPELEHAKWAATIPISTSATTQKSGLGALDRALWLNLDALLATYGVIKEKISLDGLLMDNFRHN